MPQKKWYKILVRLFSLLLLLCSCEDKITITNSPPSSSELYDFNTTFSHPNNNDDEVTLSWSQSEDISEFSIIVEEQNIEETTSSNEFTFNLLPGNFTTVIISTENNGSDTISVFAPPMSPSTWSPDLIGNIQVSEYFDDDGTPFNEIELINSTENDISDILLYSRTQSPSAVASIGEDLDESIWTEIPTFDINSSTSYSESKEFGEKFCYIAKAIDNSGNSRYSQIICNDLSPNSMSDISISQTSISLQNKILIEWTPYTNEDFYQYSIYRSDTEDFESSTPTLLAEITNSEQAQFEDRNNIGDGKSWFYQVIVTNQYGRTSESGIQEGRSRP